MQEFLPPVFSILREIEKYETAPRQTPKEFLLQLTKKIFAEKATFVELLAIGGESVVLKLSDETGKLFVAKIARSDAQNPLVTFAKNKDEKGRDMKPGSKEAQAKEQRNLNHFRFKEGAILQRDFSELLAEERIIFFGVPAVKMISTSPLYFTMPFLENLNVLRFFVDFKKSIIQVLGVFINLLKATKYIHSKGIVHRDFKSDNLFISRSFDSVIVGDWTLAKEIGDRGLTLKGTMGGSAGFAPEKLIEDGDFRNANFKDDIHALGFVLWEFVTGKRLPSQLTSNFEKREILKKRILPFLPEVLHDTFLIATHPDESKRPAIDDFVNLVSQAIRFFGEKNLVTFVSQKQSDEIDEIIVDTDVIFTPQTKVIPCSDCEVARELNELKEKLKVLSEILIKE